MVFHTPLGDYGGFPLEKHNIMGSDPILPVDKAVDNVENFQ